MKFQHVAVEICKQTDRQKHRHIHHITSRGMLMSKGVDEAEGSALRTRLRLRQRPVHQGQGRRQGQHQGQALTMLQT